MPDTLPPFLQLKRATAVRQAIEERVGHWGEFYETLPDAALREQGSRCMDCGVPFCQGDHGCPVRNVIPSWNGLVRQNRWRDALDALHATNNFPEFTGRLCPAPCESACVLGVIAEPVAIRTIEQAIADRGFDEGWIVPQRPRRESGRRVAIIGSGPAGLAAAQQLRRGGHSVTVFEKASRIGGLLRNGIPGFKLDKRVLDRRVAQLTAEGVEFRTGCDVGVSPSMEQLRGEYDAILIAIGAEAARELQVPGRDLGGVVQAMDYLVQQNGRDAGDVIEAAGSISAAGKDVVIIGGGDTGSDCAGTAIRQGARSVTQFEVMPQPPATRADSTPWPLWPMQLRTSHSHEEGTQRDWSISTTSLTGENGRVTRLSAVRVSVERDDAGAPRFAPVPGSEFHVDAQLVILAMGFTGPRRDMMSRFGVELLPSGAVKTDYEHRASVPGVYAAGDARRGASLIVWAIREGRDAAASIDAALRADRASSTAPSVREPAIAGR